MASYRDKINQKQMSTESGKIAWCIQFIESGGSFRFRKDWQLALRKHESIVLFDDVYMRQSNGEFLYVIIKSVDYKPNRYLCKYVQTGMFYDQYVNMLEAQPWQYI